MLIQNTDLKRTDITDWSLLSARSMEALVRRHESLPLAPDPTDVRREVKVIGDVPVDDRYRSAVPFFDLKVWAGLFGAAQAPQPAGWVRLPGRVLESNLFVAKIEGRSMERAIPNGAYALFRSFPLGEEPSATRLDGRRVIVRLQDDQDPETGHYTLKRWRITKLDPDGNLVEVELRPDNKDFKTLRLRSENGPARVIAEFLEVVG
jgi:hypothetical protein